MRLGCERREPEKKEGRELKRVKPKKTGRREKNRQGKTSGTSPEEKDKDSDMIKKVLEEGNLSLYLRRKQRKMEG